ncbi:ferric-dicitrate binding protein FerR, regulates iron transport through sigma-19 [Cyclobacterium xiamenense]|uniref:Ferric-dicitrate binding protein FerR, regulates iron transport through sigma-19 n=1 Tax=Cyclobacterium xiamenense TaxID=1297121 RepID=A0A1H6ZQP0_9BACT|nr:ferric-dicitrate binding protein FerR, regulates iron transport through sigma-19 [Cyclobacterium xiamenense]
MFVSSVLLETTRVLKEEKLIRFLNNRTSPEENREVTEWLAENGAEDRFIDMLRKTWEAEALPQVTESKQRQLLEQIHRATVKHQRQRPASQVFGFFFTFGRMAATFLLVAFTAFYLHEAFLQRDTVEPLAALPPTKIQKHTQAGEKLTLRLPDQSEVIVNSLSTITFYSDFGVRTREIELEGEAFFTVAPDKERPFEVKTGTVKTTALGTAFNAYAREEVVRISLTEGKVAVAREDEQLSLEPGEMASVQLNAHSALRKGTFDPMQTTLWKEGMIRFQSEPFGEILQSLEHWYGVRFERSGDTNRKVTGLFKNESLDAILTGLSFSLGFDYEIDKKNVRIKF